MSFGKELTQRMDVESLTDAELGRRVGVSRAHIGNLRNGKGYSAEIVRKTAKGLDWDIDDALLAAGFAPRNVSAHRQISDAGLNSLDHDDLKMAADYIKYLKHQKGVPDKKKAERPRPTNSEWPKDEKATELLPFLDTYRRLSFDAREFFRKHSLALLEYLKDPEFTQTDLSHGKTEGFLND